MKRVIWRDKSDGGQTHHLVAVEYHSKLGAFTFKSLLTGKVIGPFWVSDLRLDPPIETPEGKFDYDRGTILKICQDDLAERTRNK